MSSKLTLRFLNQDAMIAAGVNDMERCIDAMEEAFSLLGQGDYVMGGSTRNSHGQRVWFPPEPKFDGMPKGGPDQRFMGLVGYLGGKYKVCGNKWYGSNIYNPKENNLPRSILTMQLTDAASCRPLAFMEANLLSGTRTGAVVGLSARHLAKEDSVKLGVVAAGPIAMYCADAIVKAVPSIKSVTVFDINEEASKRFKAEIEKLGVEVIIASKMEEAIIDMDIVTSAISGSFTPDFKTEWLKPGVLLTLPGRINVEDAFIKSAYVVPDNWEMQKTYKIEGNMLPEGERAFPHPQLHRLVDKGEIAESDIHDLGQVVAGNFTIDKASDKPRYFISNGMILQDIAWACECLKMAEEKGLGQELTLWDAPYRV